MTKQEQERRNQFRHEKAVQLVLMDAIQKGHVDKGKLKTYMKTKVFKNAVKAYVTMFKEQKLY